jgi:hypothetical protein
MPATANEIALAQAVFDLQRQVAALSGARQLPSSTFETEVGSVGVLDAAVAGVGAAAAVPELQDSAAYSAGSLDDLRVELDDADDALDDVLQDAAASLDDARADLEDAQQDIADAFEQVGGDVQTAITSAAGAANVAQLAQQAALDAAGLAAAKGELIVQVTAPSGSRANTANLWIDITPDANGKPKNTPNRYNPDTAKWEPITDQRVIDAAAAAVAAQAAADGKPLILFSTSAPSGNAPTGSTWFMVNTAENIIGQWQQTGPQPPGASVWTPRAITSDIVANLDVGKLTAGNAAIAALVAQKIAASTASFQTANVANLFVTSGATMQQAVIDYLFANVVQAKKITASMIDVNTLNGVTLTGTILQTSASGKRTVLSNNRVNFFDENGLASGFVEGTNNGGSRGLLHLSSGAGGSDVYLGSGIDLPTSGSASMRVSGVIWPDEVYTGPVTSSSTVQGRYFRAPATGDVSLTSTGHAFQIGMDSGVNIVMDNNEFQARNNGAAEALYINTNGNGNVALGGSASVVTIAGLFNNPRLPIRMATGSFTQAALGNGASNTTAISFPSGRFSTGPVVFAISLNSRYNVAMAGNTTSGGGSITVSNFSGASATGSAAIWWVAIQMSESSPFG